MGILVFRGGTDFWKKPRSMWAAESCSWLMAVKHKLSRCCRCCRRRRCCSLPPISCSVFSPVINCNSFFVCARPAAECVNVLERKLELILYARRRRKSSFLFCFLATSVWEIDGDRTFLLERSYLLFSLLSIIPEEKSEMIIVMTCAGAFFFVPMKAAPAVTD